jgi:hypothetical protein
MLKKCLPAMLATGIAALSVIGSENQIFVSLADGTIQCMSEQTRGE